MIEGAYFAMFNEFYTLALQAVKDINTRAQYELFADVMLVTSAVINSLKNSPSGKPILKNKQKILLTVRDVEQANFQIN